jgi:hypothetical protein
MVSTVGVGTVVTKGFHIVRKFVKHDHKPVLPKKNKYTEDF